MPRGELAPCVGQPVTISMAGSHQLESHTSYDYDFVLYSPANRTSASCLHARQLGRGCAYSRGCGGRCYLWYFRYVFEHAIGSRRVDELFTEGLSLPGLVGCHGYGGAGGR